MITVKEIQRALSSKGFDPGPIDGILGPRTRKAAREALSASNVSAESWEGVRVVNAYQQLMMKSVGINTGEIDGYIGPQTRYALEQWQNRLRGIEPSEEEVAHQPTVWPRQRDVPAFYGKRGANQVLLDLPYPMRIAWDLKTEVSRISIHNKVADSAERAFKNILSHYGHDQLKDLNLDLFSGCLNVRKMRGGSSWSMHSWGIAIDIDHTHNQFRWDALRASMARPDHLAYVDAWYEQGWINLGRERDFDYMHFQAARL